MWMLKDMDVYVDMFVDVERCVCVCGGLRKIERYGCGCGVSGKLKDMDVYVDVDAERCGCGC